jgi:methionine-rich copper-binding protein CopC
VTPSFVRRGRCAVLFLMLLIAALVLPGGVAAHSELETSVPTDGAVLTAQPPEIVLTFTAALDKAKSSITLNDATGTELAKAGVDPADDTVMRLVPPTLAPGAYEIRWTSVALDGDLLRGIVHFSLAAPTPSPTSPPTAVPSETAATASPSPSASPALSPSPSPSPGGGPASASSSDIILPIVAAIILIALLGAWLLRGRSRGSRPW